MKGKKKDFEGGRIVYSLPEETKENHVKPQSVFSVTLPVFKCDTSQTQVRRTAITPEFLLRKNILIAWCICIVNLAALFH
jgi:hypothetical protein